MPSIMNSVFEMRQRVISFVESLGKKMENHAFLMG